MVSYLSIVYLPAYDPLPINGLPTCLWSVTYLWYTYLIMVSYLSIVYLPDYGPLPIYGLPTCPWSVTYLLSTYLPMVSYLSLYTYLPMVR